MEQRLYKQLEDLILQEKENKKLAELPFSIQFTPEVKIDEQNRQKFNSATFQVFIDSIKIDKQKKQVNFCVFGTIAWDYCFTFNDEKQTWYATNEYLDNNENVYQIKFS